VQGSSITTDVVLLGAGASREAGVQTAFEMTNAIVRGIQSSRAAGDRELAEALVYVCEGIRKDPRASVGGLDVQAGWPSLHEALARQSGRSVR